MKSNGIYFKFSTKIQNGEPFQCSHSIATWESHILLSECWFKSATTLLLLQSPGKQQMVAKHLCTSLLSGETQIYRFLIFAWHKPSCHEHLGSEPVNQRLVYLSFSLYFIWINKSKNATERQNTLGKWEVIKWIFF